MSRTDQHIEDITIRALSAEGMGIGHHPNGQVIFVPLTAPGDVADIHITRRKKSFLTGNVERLRQLSPERQQPFCQHFGHCGGCSWQHIRYETQLNAKQQIVFDALRKFAHLNEPPLLPILPADEQQFYRNKLEFTFTHYRWLNREEIEAGTPYEHRNGLGFHVPGHFDRVMDIEHCYLQPDPSNAIRQAVRAFALKEGLTFYNLKKRHGMLRTLLLRVAATGEVMVTLSCAEENRPAREKLLQHLADTFPQITSLQYVINPKGNDTIFDLEVIPFKGPAYIKEKLGGLTFRIGPKSFFQTNTAQTTKLYDTALQFASLTGKERVYDLYTGLGSIALLAAGKAKEVIGVEQIEAAVADARVNAADNEIYNVRFFAGDLKDVLTPAFITEQGRPDVIITDPPRAGMHPDVVRQLTEAGAERIVYVSCNPATMARDIELMKDKYELKKTQPVDMFPQTVHIECVSLLERKG